MVFYNYVLHTSFFVFFPLLLLRIMRPKRVDIKWNHLAKKKITSPPPSHPFSFSNREWVMIRYDNVLITCISCFHIWYFRLSLHSILHQAIKALHHELDEVDCIQSFCHSLFLLVIWDEVPTMVEIAIFWFQI